MMISPLKADTFSRTFSCKPTPVAIETSIMIIPNAIAVIAIFIIGADILLLWFGFLPEPDLIIRLAMKYSKFKIHTLLSFKNSTLFLMLVVLISFSCKGQEKNFKVETSFTESEVTTYPVVGANQTREYLPFLRNKRVGVVANQTTVVFKPENFIFMEDYWDENSRSYKQRQTQKWLFSKRTHLVDSLLAQSINVTKVFAPEHGFRGTADAGELVKDGKDNRTGLPLISLYGSNKKPTPEQMKD